VLAQVVRSRLPVENVVVLGLPRGGVPVGAEIAKALGASLDVFLVRKLGVPGHEELAFGAVASGGTRVLNEELVDQFGLNSDLIAAVSAREHAELQRRELAYRESRKPVELRGATAVVVDDGLATGATMRVALLALRKLGPMRLMVAVPVGSRTAYEYLKEHADEIVCPATPQEFHSVGEWYRDFRQVSDDEVCTLLKLAEVMGSV
jgi:putative phosphoribosyl transferase